ncbi:MAG: hypothetical protein U1F43_13160 [Myxococcota bacterium]
MRSWGALLGLGLAVSAAACSDDAAGADAGDTAQVQADVPDQSLCAKYGGAATVATVVQSYVVPELAGDCRISAFFTSLSSDGLGHVVECLTTQVQELFGCRGITYAGSSDSRGAACRSMVEAHVGLQIGKADFDALIEDVVTGLTKAGVAEADINAAAPALLGMAGDIVEQPDVTAPTHEICQ